MFFRSAEARAARLRARDARRGIWRATAGAIGRFSGTTSSRSTAWSARHAQALRSTKKPAEARPIVRKASSIGHCARRGSSSTWARQEKPTNRTAPSSEVVRVDGVFSCNIFVSYCFAVGAKYVVCAGFKGAGVYPKGCTYVPTTEAWLRATGIWKGATTPLPGTSPSTTGMAAFLTTSGSSRSTSVGGSSMRSRAIRRSERLERR